MFFFSSGEGVYFLNDPRKEETTQKAAVSSEWVNSKEDTLVFPTSSSGKKQLRQREEQNSLNDKSGWTLEEEELLLDMIAKNPILWNFRMPMTQRKASNASDKDKTWDRIAASFDDKFSRAQVEGRWNTLKAFHLKMVKNEQGRSGAAALSKNVQWSLYKCMDFYKRYQFCAP